MELTEAQYKHIAPVLPVQRGNVRVSNLHVLCHPVCRRAWVHQNQNSYPKVRPIDVKSSPNVEVKPKRISSVRKLSSSHEDPRLRATS